VNRTDDNIGQAFKQAFDGFEIQPSESLWESVNKANIDSGVTKPLAQFRNLFYGMAAAIVVVVSIYGIYKFENTTNKEVIIDNKIENAKPVIDEVYSIEKDSVDDKTTQNDVHQNIAETKVIKTNKKKPAPEPNTKSKKIVVSNCGDAPVSEKEAFASVDSMVNEVATQEDKVADLDIEDLDENIIIPVAKTQKSTPVNEDNSDDIVVNNEIDSFKVDYSNDPIICFGEDAILEVEDGFYYTWNTGEVGNKIIVSPIENSYYSVTVTNSQGQKDVHKYSVKIDMQCSALMIPSAFTPNGDGKNDVFGAEGIGISNLLLTVYSPMGQKLFETKSLEQTWDGRFNGELMPAAMYFYQANYTDAKGENHIKRGQITLIR
jgi:gliding motility-associated-like protein